MRKNSWGTEEELVARLRAGDESAFAALVDELHRPLVAFARTFTSSGSLPEEIVQETWLAVIRGLPRFEGRSSIRTWVFGILIRRARTMAVREARQAAAGGPDPATGESPNGAGPEPEWVPGQGRVGLWNDLPVPWQLDDPAALHESSEALEVVTAALEALPPAQRQIVLLRDVEGLSADEACNILGLSETNQRVLLHRGRAAIRRALDRYVRDGLRPRSRTSPVGQGGGKGGGGE